MVDFGGSCIGKAANSATLSVDIRLSRTTPQEVIQQLHALMVDSPTNTAPKDQPTAVDGILRIWLKLSIDLAAIYYVVWVGIGIVQLLTWLQPHFQDIKKAITGLTVTFEQLMESVAKTQVEEHLQPTEKNELHEKIGESTSDSANGD